MRPSSCVEPQRGQHAQNSQDHADKTRDRGELSPLDGQSDVPLCRSCEHLDQLRLEAGRQSPARVAFRIGKFFEVVDQPGQRDPIGAVGRQVISGNLGHPAVAPLEKAARLVDGVDDVRNLKRLGKKSSDE